MIAREVKRKKTVAKYAAKKSRAESYIYEYECN